MSWDRFVAAGPGGLGMYESHYLKANSPDGQRGVWLKHTLLRPLDSPGIAECWAVLFERGQLPIVAKTEVPYAQVHAAPDRIALRAGPVLLTADQAEGKLADLSWSLRLSGGGPALRHFPHPWMYRGRFPKKKMLTPAPNLKFEGRITLGSRAWPVEGWVGLRGHNWGTEHAFSYAYGNCNLWDDHHPSRTVDGFTTRILLGGRPSPWLTLVVGRCPSVQRNRFRDWLGTGVVAPDRWAVSWNGHRRPSGCLELSADPAAYAGLRYSHPNGDQSYCYNTKFADVRWTHGQETATSRCGELEVLFPHPLAEVPLHPQPGWSAADGDYRSNP